MSTLSNGVKPPDDESEIESEEENPALESPFVIEENKEPEEVEYITQNSSNSKQQKKSGHFFVNDDESEKFTKLYRQLVEAQNEFDCKVNIPQFAFIGVQSSGKSSALSQMLSMPSGVVQDGTGTRCPIRFTLSQDFQSNKRIIQVNKTPCKNYIEMTKAVCKYTKGLGDNFDETILEISISGPEIPNFVVVDLPGLIKKKSKPSFTLAKMTKRFLTEKLPTGGWAYIPVFIRAAVDLENDDDPDEIERLCKSSGRNWRKDSIIVINKIDRSWNRSCDELTNYIETLVSINPASSVVTMCNPRGMRIDGTEKPEETEQKLRQIPDLEKEEWEKKLQEVTLTRTDGHKLKRLVKQYCYITRLKKIMTDRSIQIVKDSIGPVKAKLEQVEKKFHDDIKNMEKQLHMCEPENLRKQKAAFDDEFLKLQKRYYQGELGDEEDFRMSWEDEMEQFKTYKDVVNNTNTKYDYGSHKHVGETVWADKYLLNVQDLQKSLQYKEEVHSAELNQQIGLGLSGSADLFRALELWKAVLSFMSLPNYSIEDVLNTNSYFQHHLYFNLEDTVEKLLLKASEHLKNGCVWLGSYMEWKLILDGQRLYEKLLNFKIKTQKENANMAKIYEYTFIEYKKYIKQTVKNFISTSKVEPKDLCAILDSKAAQHYANLGELMQKDYKELTVTNANQNGIDIIKDQINETNLAKKNEYFRKNKNDNGNNSDNEIEELPGTDDDNEEETSVTDDENKDSDIDKENHKHLQRQMEQEKDEQLKLANFNKEQDLDFYYKVLVESNKMFHLRDDVAFIRHNTKVHWRHVKFHVIKTIQEKFNHRIMYHITQRSTELSTALRNGVEKPQLLKQIEELALAAGINIGVLTNNVLKLKEENEKKTGGDKMAPDFSSLTNEDLEKKVGVDADALRNKIKQLRQNLHKFQKMKADINHNLAEIENQNNIITTEIN